jgi:tetratricopeptide (TPR) repeat protein
VLHRFADKGCRAFGLGTLFLSLLSAQTAEQVEQSRRGKEMMAAGRFAEAATIYESLVRTVPGNTGLLANLAMALHMAGRDREAVDQFARVLQVQPRAYPALMMAAVSHMRLGEPAKAAPLLERALKLQPSDMEARSMLADALLMLGRHDAAVPHLKAIAAAKPKDAKAWYGLGRSYELLAQAAYEQLLKLHPESPYTVAITADARLKQGRLNSAFALYKQAGEVAGVHAGIAEVYEKSGRAEWAAKERAKEKKPSCATPTLACRFAAGQHSALIQAAKARRDAEALFWLIRSYNQLALDAFRKLTDLPPSPELNEVVAELYRNQGRYKESIAAWEEAIRLAPSDGRLRLELATTLYLSRDYAAAEKLLTELKADDPDALFMLGDSMLNQQRAAEAIPHLQRAVELQPRYPHAHAALARSYVQTGDTAKAIPHLEQSLQVDTGGALHYQLARAYQAAGRMEDAKRLLARSQELQRSSSEPGMDITAP